MRRRPVITPQLVGALFGLGAQAQGQTLASYWWSGPFPNPPNFLPIEGSTAHWTLSDAWTGQPRPSSGPTSVPCPPGTGAQMGRVWTLGKSSLGAWYWYEGVRCGDGSVHAWWPRAQWTRGGWQHLDPLANTTDPFPTPPVHP